MKEPKRNTAQPQFLALHYTSHLDAVYISFCHGVEGLDGQTGHAPFDFLKHACYETCVPKHGRITQTPL